MITEGGSGVVWWTCSTYKTIFFVFMLQHLSEENISAPSIAMIAPSHKGGTTHTDIYYIYSLHCSFLFKHTLPFTQLILSVFFSIFFSRMFVFYYYYYLWYYFCNSINKKSKRKVYFIRCQPKSKTLSFAVILSPLLLFQVCAARGSAAVHAIRGLPRTSALPPRRTREGIRSLTVS